METMSKYGSAINRPLCEIVGLSTDTKPTDKTEGIRIQNGSVFIEMDTGKKYMFDAENSQWKLIGSGGGGGGGSATLIEKSITTNGTYNASDDNADGYSKVMVNVPVYMPAAICYCGIATSGTTPFDTKTLEGKTQDFMLFFPINGVVDFSNIFDSALKIGSQGIIVGAVSKINIDTTKVMYATCLTFKTSDNYEGIYVNGIAVTPTGATITSGNWYNILVQGGTVTAETNNDLGIFYAD